MPRIWKFADDVDTDQIVPGRYAPYMRPDDDVADAVFVEAHPEFNQHAIAGDIVVAGNNFGCGSSREYAPLALKRRGISAIIARSFARIFYRNSLNLGLPVFESDELVEALEDGQEIELSIETGEILCEGIWYWLPALPEFARQTIAAGGIAKFVKEHGTFPGM